MQKFKVNDSVVYPGHGVGTITNAQVKEILGRKQIFFTVNLQSGLKIMLPQDNVKFCGLRKVMRPFEIKKVLSEIEQFKKIDYPAPWSTRYRDLMERVKSGEFKKVCEVIRDIKSRDGDLSFGERKMLDLARELATSEIMLALNLPHLDAYKIVTEKVG